MEEKKAKELLSTIGNEKLIKQWEELAPNQKQHLFSQLSKIDIPTLRLQRQLIDQSQKKNNHVTPFQNYARSGIEEDVRVGMELIAKGLMGCLLVAGGQGSRLHIDGPKGLCEVTKIKKKSLFRLFAEKTIAAGKQAGRPLLLAIMTSPLNHQETVDYFEENAFFGLKKKQLTFFQQETLPLLDGDGDLFLESQDQLAMGPDGNGGALHQFFASGIWKDWYVQGVRYLNFVLIDNPLADPFDAELIGYQKRKASDVAIKCIQRGDPQEKVGVLVKENGKAAVIEYTELSEEDRLALKSDRSLRHPLANLSLFSFKMEFIKSVATDIQPSLHKAFKAVRYLNRDGMSVKAEEPMAWKFEKYIFDILPFAEKVDALVYLREVSFAPLKNFSGADSFETVADALERNDRRILSEVTGITCELSPLEISQEFYYPTARLLEKWKGKGIDHAGYVES